MRVSTLTEGCDWPLRTGSLLDGERKSIAPIAAWLVDRARDVDPMPQRVQRCVVVSPWDTAEVVAWVSRTHDRELPGLTALNVDDTGCQLNGTHSVGVARQYSGMHGRTDNCQITTSLHLAGRTRARWTRWI